MLFGLEEEGLVCCAAATVSTAHMDNYNKSIEGPSCVAFQCAVNVLCSATVPSQHTSHCHFPALITRSLQQLYTCIYMYVLYMPTLREFTC